MRILRSVTALAVASLVLAGCGGSGSSTTFPSPVPLDTATLQKQNFMQRVNHFIVIYQENWSFDALYGNYPGANGYNNGLAGGFTQVDINNNKIPTLPAPLNGGKPDPNFAAVTGKPTAPWNMAIYQNVQNPNLLYGDPNHNFYFQQYELDGNRLDKYIDPTYASSNQGAMALGYWDVTNLPEGKIVQQYTLLDNYKQGTFGGSYINNTFFFCGCVLTAPNAPKSVIEPTDPLSFLPDKASLAAIGGPEGRLTPDGYVVNTSFPIGYPQISGNSANAFVPPATNPTFGDRLTAAGVSWGFYSGGLAKALAGTPDSTFQAHHQAPLYFQNWQGLTPNNLTGNIKDFDASFTADLAAGKLPAVTIIKPLGAYNEHPGYASLINGQTFVANLISQIQMSSAWKDTMILVFYDEAGGHWDHVPVSPLDRWGPATRVPAYVVSPFARRGYIDHSNYEVMSFWKTVELRYGLQPLTSRDANAQDMVSMFDFSQPIPQAFARRPLGTLPAAPVPPSYTGRAPVTELDD